MYQRPQTRSQTSSTRRKRSSPEPPTPIKPPLQLLDPELLNVIPENHATSDERRDVEQRLCYQQTGSKEYFQESEFKATDYIPKHDHLGRELPDRRDGADPMKLRMIQDVIFILGNLINLKCAVEEQDFNITPDVIGTEMGDYSKTLRGGYVETFTGLDGFEFKDSQTEEALIELGLKIEALHKSSTNISNILKSSKFKLEQLNTLFPAVEQAVTEALEVKNLLSKDGPEIPDDDFDESSDSFHLVAVLRSEDMHKVANKRHKTAKGYSWKWGGEHTDHAESWPKKYNLVPESKFDDAIEKLLLWEEYELEQQQLKKQKKEQQLQSDFDNFVDPSAYD